MLERARLGLEQFHVYAKPSWVQSIAAELDGKTLQEQIKVAYSLFLASDMTESSVPRLPDAICAMHDRVVPGSYLLQSMLFACSQI